MIPIVEQIRVGEKQAPNGKMVPVYTCGKTVGLIRTSDELRNLFVHHVFAELDFKNEKRPALAKRAFNKAHKYSDLQLDAIRKESGHSAYSAKQAKQFFKLSYKFVVAAYRNELSKVSLTH